LKVDKQGLRLALHGSPRVVADDKDGRRGTPSWNASTSAPPESPALDAYQTVDNWPHVGPLKDATPCSTASRTAPRR
jgi:hypothetical protein